MLRLFFVFLALAQTTAAPGRANDVADAAFRLGVPPDYARVHAWSKVREPQCLVSIGGRDALGHEQRLTPAAARAWTRMRDAAARDGVELRAVSTFRSVEVQSAIVRGKLARGQSIDAILRVNAAPGYSEHHSGRAIDITTPGYAPTEEEFERSSAFAWLMKHARAYGFVLSYPRGNAHALAYEPWHWCWQGDDADDAPATQLAANIDLPTNAGSASVSKLLSVGGEVSNHGRQSWRDVRPSIPQDERDLMSN